MTETSRQAENIRQHNKVSGIIMSNITTIIFDVYETLAHNETGLWIGTFGRICRDQGLNIEAQDLFDQWKQREMVFRRDRLNLEEPESSPPFKTYEEAWRDCFLTVFAELGLDGDAVAAAKYAIHDMGLREPYQDALEALPEIQARWRTGILSNADDAYLFPLLSRLDWTFEVVLSSEGARAYKPLPAPFVQVLGALGVTPEEAVYVGDAPYDDVVGAKGVSMRVAWVNRNGAARDANLPKPDYELRSLVELLDILGGMD